MNFTNCQTQTYTLKSTVEQISQTVHIKKDRSIKANGLSLKLLKFDTKIQHCP